MKVYQEANVLEGFYQRVNYTFDHFDHVCVSVSGGKDSSVMVQLLDKVAIERGRKYDVLFIDLEAQYRATMEHIEELKLLPGIKDFYHVAMPLYLRNAVSQLQPKWICWNPLEKDKWVRNLPKDSINLDNSIFPFYEGAMEFEEFVPAFTEWYRAKYQGLIAFCVGIRTDESLNRWRTIASDSKETFKEMQWTTLLKIGQRPVDGVYNVYPLYDWKTQDIWGAASRLDLKINRIYDLMYKNGLSIHEARLCQPYGDDQRNGLDQFRALEHDTWEKVLNRVSGVNFGNIYCRTSALGNIKSEKPDFMTWQQYTVFLLESLGLYNKELQMHYIEKIEKFFAWWEKEHGCKMEDVPDFADLKLESAKRVPTWRRIARAIERNDFYMKRLTFSQNKSDEVKLRNMIEKYDNFLHKGATTDKHLNQFIVREGIE